VSHDEEALGLFDERLRALNPALLRSLTNNQETQPPRLLETLALLIALLDNPTALSARLKLLEAQRRQNHITDEQIRQVGAALLWVIERQLGDAFTGDIQNAWVQFFRFLVWLITE
jgi:hemoglobin-like flavoprotein